jgi:hypothetical protein
MPVVNPAHLRRERDEPADSRDDNAEFDAFERRADEAAVVDMLPGCGVAAIEPAAALRATAAAELIKRVRAVGAESLAQCAAHIVDMRAGEGRFARIAA